MHNAQCKTKIALFAALALFAADIHAQATETGGAAGFAAGAVRRLDAAWASNNHVKASAYYADYDNDCLENWAEEALGTSPWTNDVAGVSVATAKSIGAFDLVPGTWKATHGLTAPYSWSLDPDGDGWDNWSEWMAGTDPNAATNRPNPTLAVTLDYQAALSGRLVVWCHSREDMHGWPDAVYARAVAIDAPPATVELTDADLVHGHIRQGPCWFFAWMDGGASAAGLPAWSDGCPAAIADNQLDGIGIGFGRNDVTFHLTDKPESFARFSWAGQMPYGDDVNVDIIYAGEPVFSRVIKWPRTWLHEGDIISWNRKANNYAGHSFGLGALEDSVRANDEAARGFVVSLTPQRDYDAGQWSVAEFCVISNWMHATLPVPTPYRPVGGEAVTDARPVFRFSLDPEYTEFQLRLKTAGAANPWYDRRILAPGRAWNPATGRRDLVEIRAPFAVGDIWNNAAIVSWGASYEWQVIGYSPALRADANASAWVPFRAAAESSSGWRLRYAWDCASADTATGAGAESNRVHVLAYPSPHCADGTEAAHVRGDWVAAWSGTMSGLPGPGPWYVRADSALGRGYVEHGRRPIPVYAEPAGGPLSITNRIVIRDCR